MKLLATQMIEQLALTQIELTETTISDGGSCGHALDYKKHHEKSNEESNLRI